MKRYLLNFLVIAAIFPAAAQTNATIDIDTTTTTPVHPNFSGYNDEVAVPIEYYDYRFNTLALDQNMGWVRFPGGITSDAYNWKTGELEPSWVTQFASNAVAGPLLPQSQLQLQGKGGAKLIDAANRANFLSSRLIMDVNGFTDTPQSAGELAAYAKANAIPVAVWELCNEAYNFPQFFKNASDYLTRMKPFRDAIKAADPSAIVAIFANDPGRNPSPNNPWDTTLGAFADKYWDAVTYHYYPAQSTGGFNQWMADENAVLATMTNTYITGHLAPLSPPGTLFVLSEFNPSLGNGGGTTSNDSLTNGTLYGAIYAAEFTMRMSTVPSLLYAGTHAIFNFSGVEAVFPNDTVVANAANAGTTIDTTTLNFGWFYGAQSRGVAIMNSVVNHAVKSDKTTVTGGASVPATGMAGGTPALYAMAYSSAAGGLSVVVTNKSATPHQVTILVNGTAASGPFATQFITGTDPTVMNTSTAKSPIAIQTASSANPVTVPPYSVLRADIVTPAVATLVNSASYQAGSLAPSQLVSAFGYGFAAQVIGAAVQPLPSMLGDTTISITDSAGTTSLAPLDYVSPSQANFQVPTGLASGAATLKVMRSGSTVLTGSFNIATSAPGIFAANGNGAGVIAGSVSRVGASGTLPLPLFSCQNGVALSCLSTPIPLGSATDTVYVTFFATGIRGAANVSAYVAGQPAPLQYAGPQGQFAGLDQVNISIPRTLAGMGEASLYLIADGKTSNVMSINVQ